jgi:hypothetical protein
MNNDKIYWFFGDKEHGGKLMGELVRLTGLKLNPSLSGQSSDRIYYGYGGEIRFSPTKENFSVLFLQEHGTEIEYDSQSGKVVELPRMAPKGIGKPGPIPFFMVYVDGCRGPEYRHWAVQDARDEAVRLSTKTNRKAYVLVPITKFVPSVSVSEAPFDDSDSDYNLPF